MDLLQQKRRQYAFTTCTKYHRIGSLGCNPNPLFDECKQHVQAESCCTDDVKHVQVSASDREPEHQRGGASWSPCVGTSDVEPTQARCISPSQGVGLHPETSTAINDLGKSSSCFHKTNVLPVVVQSDFQEKHAVSTSSNYVENRPILKKRCTPESVFLTFHEYERIVIYLRMIEQTIELNRACLWVISLIGGERITIKRKRTNTEAPSNLCFNKQELGGLNGFSEPFICS